jgi:hypothetical protein
MPEREPTSGGSGTIAVTAWEADPKNRTCQECGMLLDHPGEFHPFLFCMLKKLGKDPWLEFSWAVERLTGEAQPAKPPLVRDLPERS